MSDCDDSGIFEDILNFVGTMFLFYVFFKVVEFGIKLVIIVIAMLFKLLYLSMNGVLITIDHIIYDKKDRALGISYDLKAHPRNSRWLVNPVKRNIMGLMIGVVIGGGAFIGSLHSLDSPSAKEHPPFVAAQVNAKLLNARTSATTHSDVLFQIPELHVVNVLKNKGTWSYIEIKNDRGWVATRYLSQSRTKPSEEQAKLPQFVLATKMANVRAKPSMKGEVLFKLAGDGPIFVLKKKGNWSFIESRGFKGWIATNLLTAA
ncbi:hypothetical protein VIN01S_17210 [Vibrio inusitatus NBRC 102082]|uniref:SH3b domain-containing protein n=1 Tax=Vibrio inusitatus NBRC 102082 TaxID=1219070 RepID=A0A4Y3HV34_9VIBR|nr:SH3 domain-containing protein [Vibrio inusitatus]GEA50917.1 hypothetical protein VIN01S_17210 [Vibrio inusitatus NBRC 102082]